MQVSANDVLHLSDVLAYIAKLTAPLALAGLGYLIRAVVRIETILTGAEGTNGLVGDTKALKASKHRIDNNVQALGAAIMLTRSEARLEPIPLRLRSEGE